MPIKLLSDLQPGERGKIIKMGGSGIAHRRLLDMGMVSGTYIEMQRTAPLGDPVEIKLKGFNLSLRKKEAAKIKVEVD